jgi:hypothetical protein
MCEHYFNQLSLLQDKYFIEKSLRLRNKIEVKWLTIEIKSLMNKRDFVKKKFNKLRARGILDKELFQEYKNLRNTVVRLIRKEKSNYYSSLLENSDNVCNVLSEVIPTTNSKKKVKKQGNDCFDAEILNQHFITAAAKKVNEIEMTEDSYNALNIDILCGKQFSSPVVDNETVLKRVENLSTKKASGTDNLSVRFLQMLINYICSSITYLINCCLRVGVMPKVWKSAKVTALFKSGDKKNMNNFRLISIHAAISKVIESVVFEHLHHNLLENQLLSQKQFGFRKNDSTTGALLCIQKTTLNAIEKKKKVIIITLDLFKAFDSVDHNLLLLKLFMIGCDLVSMK